MLKRILLLSALVFTFGCKETDTPLPAAPEPVRVEPTPIDAHPIVAKIADVLQPGWDVVQRGKEIIVSRRKPVAMYTNVALPPRGGGLKEVMTQNNRPTTYTITLEIGDRVSKPNYLKTAEANESTEEKLRQLTWGMDDFRSKTDYRPRNDREKEMYEEYRQSLRDLPYEKLPDLYDENNSFYVTTPRHTRESFSYQREERECRAVLENIFSFLDSYHDLNEKTEDDEFDAYPSDRIVTSVFYSDRPFDKHQVRKMDNLPELHGK